MQVIILATDEQRKLPPLTDTLPAPMLPIVDRPVMATTVEIVARAGHKQILVSLYERGGQIAAYFGGGRRWGVDIQFVTQRQAWGTAGALRWASSLLNETFLVLPGDAMVDLDIAEALAYHQTHGGAATAILHLPKPGSRAPRLQTTAAGQVLGIEHTVPDYASLQATGAFIFEPSVLAHIPAQTNFDLIDDLLPALSAAGQQVYGYEMRSYWNSLDSLQAYQEAQRVYLYSAYRERAGAEVLDGPAERVRFASLEGRPIAPGVWVGQNHAIHPSVKVAPPLYIGENSWIGREVELGAGSVIGTGVVIDEEATVSGSSVLANTYVGRLVDVTNRIVTPNSISDPEANETTLIVDPFLIGRVGAAADGRSPVRRAVSAMATLLLIALLSPLWLLVGLLAALASGGQPLTRSPRVGQRGKGESAQPRTFQIVHFQTRRPDGRYTLVGRLLERLELHRLPELLNVLRGEMGLVGVKPLRPEEAARLTEEWHQRRHEFPAGITGLWYIQAEPGSDLDTAIVTDVYYAAMRTWRGDMLLLWRTPGTWFRRAIQGVAASNDQEYLIKADKMGSM